MRIVFITPEAENYAVMLFSALLKRETNRANRNNDTEEALKAKLDKGRIEGILADPTHWCPSKAEQWKRMADAIIKEDK